MDTLRQLRFVFSPLLQAQSKLLLVCGSSWHNEAEASTLFRMPGFSVGPPYLQLSRPQHANSMSDMLHSWKRLEAPQDSLLGLRSCYPFETHVLYKAATPIPCRMFKD